MDFFELVKRNFLTLREVRTAYRREGLCKRHTFRIFHTEKFHLMHLSMFSTINPERESTKSDNERFKMFTVHSVLHKVMNYLVL